MIANPSQYPPRALWLLAGVSLFWGLNWPMMKMAVSEMPVWNFRALCICAGMVWCYALVRYHKQSFYIPREHHWRLVMCALTNVTAWNLFAGLALTLLPAGRTSLLAYTMPLWVVLLSRFLLKESVDLWRWFALAIGMAGGALLLVDEVEILKRAPWGALFALLGGFFWAFGVVLTKGFPREIPTMTLIGWQMVLGGMPILLGALILSPTAWTVQSTGAWLGIAYNILVAFGFCHFAWNEIVRILPANVSGIASLAVPVVGVTTSLILLGERPRAFDLVALALLVAAVAINLFVPKAEPKTRSP